MSFPQRGAYCFRSKTKVTRKRILDPHCRKPSEKSLRILLKMIFQVKIEQCSFYQKVNFHILGVMGWVCPLKIHTLKALSPNAMAPGEAFGVVGPEGTVRGRWGPESRCSGWNACLVRDQRARPLCLHHVRREQKGGCPQTKKWALTWHQICRCLDFGPFISRTARNKCLSVKPPSRWYFVVRAQTD